MHNKLWFNKSWWNFKEKFLSTEKVNDSNKLGGGILQADFMIFELHETELLADMLLETVLNDLKLLDSCYILGRK